MLLWSSLKKKFLSIFGAAKPTTPAAALDVATLTQQFNLLDTAKRMAKLGLPAFHSKTLSEVELEVVRYIEHVRTQCQRQASEELEQLDAKIAEVHASQLQLKTVQATADFERQARVVFNEQNAWLEKIGHKASRRMAELDRFRQVHALDRDAIYPEGSGVFARYAVLLLLVVLEGVFNASFFAEGLATGLIGGFTYAATLAALNVMVMFFLGKSVLRWIFHRHAALRFTGFVGLLLSLAYTVTVALAIAHLRTAILADSSQPTKDAWATLIHDPLAMNDLLSWVLFMVTIGFGLGALLDGLFMDDLYPGYGDVTRREKLAVEEFEEEFEEVRQALEELRQDNLDALDRDIAQTHARVARHKQLQDEKKALHKVWLKTLEDSEVALYAALRIFRAENERHRKDRMRPSYFDTLPPLNPVTLPRPDTAKLEAEHAGLAREATLLEESLSERKARVYALFDQHLEELNFIKKSAPKT